LIYLVHCTTNPGDANVWLPIIYPISAVVTARKDDAPADVQAAVVNVAGLNSSSAGGGLIQTTSG